MNQHEHMMHEHGEHEHTAVAHAERDHSDAGHTERGHVGHGGHGHAGHGGHGDHVGQFRRLFWIMLVLAVPVVGFNDMFAHLIGYHLPEAAWVSWVSPVLGTVVYFWGGWPFLTGGLSEIRSRKPGMMLLIALAITVAFVSSWGASLNLLDRGLNFWWELALLVVIMLLGHWIEMRSLAQTSSALDSLAALLPDEGTDEGDAVRYWLHYAEGSAMPPLVMRLVLGRIPTSVPWPLRPVARAITGGVETAYLGPEMTRQLDWWEASLTGDGWFAAGRFTAADVMMSFPVEMAALRSDLSTRPATRDWLTRIHARPAYVRALQAGGPYSGAAAG